MNAPSVTTNGRSDYLGLLSDAWAKHLRPREDNAPTVVSLFAGCGGSSLGYSMAGDRELLAVEWDAEAVKTFRLNFPGVTVYHGDIRRLSVSESLRLSGLQERQLDVLDGSPPCQGFSTAGKRELTDSRNMLFSQFVRLLRGLQPKGFIMENVSGMVKGRMKLVFAECLRELKASGYQVRARLLNAMYFDVPQSRSRMMFVGIRGDLGIAPSYPRPHKQVFTLRDAIGHLGNTQDVTSGHIWVDESPTGRNTRTWHKADAALPGRKYATQKQRLRWDRPAKTLTTGGIVPGYLRSMTCHPQYTRMLSCRECQLVGSFPESWRWGGRLPDILRQIGNSVPPLFMRVIAAHLRDAARKGSIEP